MAQSPLIPYSPDLVEYLEEIDQNPPTKALKDKELLRRCLSSEAPPLLNGITGQALQKELGGGIEMLENHPAINTISAFERGRIFGLLGHKEAARSWYIEAFRHADNDDLRVKIICNQSVVLDPEDAKRLLASALTKYRSGEIFIALASIALHENNNDHAEFLLHLSLDYGRAHAAALLAEFYTKTCKDADVLKEKLNTLIDRAALAGIPGTPNDWNDLADLRVIRRNKKEEIVNMYAPGHKARVENEERTAGMSDDELAKDAKGIFGKWMDRAMKRSQ